MVGTCVNMTIVFLFSGLRREEFYVFQMRMGGNQGPKKKTNGLNAKPNPITELRCMKLRTEFLV
jgi:hypothetical protein